MRASQVASTTDLDALLVCRLRGLPRRQVRAWVRLSGQPASGRDGERVRGEQGVCPGPYE